MTRDEIMALPAGRELDALVAEKVMGCKVRTMTPPKGETGDRCADHGGGEDFECWCSTENGIRTDGTEHAHFGPDRYDPDESVKCRVIPEYSEDIADAWQVVEKIKQLHPDNDEPDSTLHIGWNGPDCHWFVCWLIPRDYEQDACYTTATADTAPLAICRAALLAVQSGLEDKP